MTFTRIIILFLLTLNVFAQSKKTAIVFIDLNNSFNEVKAAKKAAALRGEEIYVFPTTEAEKPYKAEQFRKSLKSLNDKGVEISSLIMSGHHTYSNGYYGEEYTNKLHPNEISEELAKFPKLRNSIRSFFGAGCHSLTKPQAQRWAEYFENLEVCGGYMNIGPGNQAAAAGQNIFDFLVKEDKVAKINSVDQLLKTDIFKYGNMTAIATLVISKESGATYCNIDGEVSKLTSCSIQEDMLSAKFLTLRAATFDSYVQETSTMKKAYGSLKTSPSFQEIKPGLFKVKSSILPEELEQDTIVLLDALEDNCPDSELLNQITYNDVYSLRDTAAVVKNHKLYFEQAFKEIEALGVYAPREGANPSEYPVYYKMALKALKEEMKKSKKLSEELKGSWGGFWNSVSSDHQKKVKAQEDKFTKAEALKGIISFMKKQVVDRECLTYEWTQDYAGKKSQDLIKDMMTNKNHCEGY